MNQQRINAARLYADITIEDNTPTKLVFYERDKQNQLINSWTTNLSPGYKVENGVITYPKQELEKEEIALDNIANLEIPLYNTALYFFNRTMIKEEELYFLEEKLVELYDKHYDHFEEYIEETFASVEFAHSKYFYSAYLIQELMGAFQMLDCLQQKDLECNKRFVLKMQ